MNRWNGSIGVQMDGQMNGQMNGQMDIWIDRQIDKQICKQIDRQKIDRQIDRRWIDRRWTVRQIDRWMYGLIDRQTEKRKGNICNYVYRQKLYENSAKLKLYKISTSTNV